MPVGGRVADTIVLQSHRNPLPHDWLITCIDSVRSWCAENRYEHRFIGDELFENVPKSVLDKTRDQVVIASDIARLLKIRELLKQNYERVVWCDADFLIFNPAKFSLPRDNYALGREVWVQRLDGRPNKLTSHIKVHNAFLMFAQGNAFLEFYIDAAERLIEQNNGRMSPQYIGPKFLTAIHNVAQCPVLETAGMLCPLVVDDIVNRGGPALDLFRHRSPQSIAGANLCHSLCERGELSATILENCIERLLQGGAV
jgi:hypothetical protein